MRTLLALVVAAVCAGCDGKTCPSTTERFEVKGENFQGIQYAESGFICLTRDPSVIRFPVLGTYQYENAGTFGPPIIRLSRDDGQSVFQKHGVTEQKIDWGVLMDLDSVPVGLQSSTGAKLLFFWKLLEAGQSTCTPGTPCDPAHPQSYPNGVGEWDATNLSVSFTEQKLFLLGERELACSTDCVLHPGIKAAP